MAKTESWFWSLAWFITAVAVAGNALVIFLITTKHHLRKKPNWFILSLAIADLFVGFTYIPPFYACRKWFPCSRRLVCATNNKVVISLRVCKQPFYLDFGSLHRPHFTAETQMACHTDSYRPLGHYRLDCTGNKSSMYLCSGVPQQRSNSLQISRPGVSGDVRVCSMHFTFLLHISHGLYCSKKTKL